MDAWRAVACKAADIFYHRVHLIKSDVEMEVQKLGFITGQTHAENYCAQFSSSSK